VALCIIHHIVLVKFIYYTFELLSYDDDMIYDEKCNTQNVN